MKIQILSIMLLFSCGQNQDTSGSIQIPDSKIISTVKLSKQLSEISGLTMNHDSELFAHNDEKSIVYQLDYQNGDILKKFTVGKKPIKEDFEGITFANNLFYLVTSNGDIYEFPEGDNGEEVKYEKYKTFLVADNNVEFRANICCVFLIENIFRLFAYGYTGILTRSVVVMALLLGPAVIIGMKAGFKMYSHLDAKVIHYFVIVLLLVSGSLLSIRSLLAIV